MVFVPFLECNAHSPLNGNLFTSKGFQLLKFKVKNKPQSRSISGLSVPLACEGCILRCLPLNACQRGEKLPPTLPFPALSGYWHRDCPCPPALLCLHRSPPDSLALSRLPPSDLSAHTHLGRAQTDAGPGPTRISSVPSDAGTPSSFEGKMLGSRSS